MVESPSFHAGQRQVNPTMYVPFAQEFLARMNLMMTAEQVDEELVAAVQRQLDAVEGGRMPPVVTTLEAHFSRTALAAERIAATLVGACAVMGLSLAALGLSGAMGDAARQRNREFAVRIALGARSRNVIAHVLSEGLRVAAFGTLAGTLAALLAGRWLRQFMPDAAAPGLWTWLVPPLALALAVAVAAVLPARRALAVSPLGAMREE